MANNPWWLRNLESHVNRLAADLAALRNAIDFIERLPNACQTEAIVEKLDQEESDDLERYAKALAEEAALRGVAIPNDAIVLALQRTRRVRQGVEQFIRYVFEESVDRGVEIPHAVTAYALVRSGVAAGQSINE